MWKKIRSFFGQRPPTYTISKGSPEFLLTEACIKELAECLSPERLKRHEGIAYLFGQTDGNTSLAVVAFRPAATTTAGSFFVDTQAMAQVVRAATNLGLKVVAQVHTHPGMAYHSDGDIDGAKIRYPGFNSIVLPDYGHYLPKLDGAAFYFFTKNYEWDELEREQVRIIPNRIS